MCKKRVGAGVPTLFLFGGFGIMNYRSAWTISPLRETSTLQLENPRRFRRNMISGASRGCTPGRINGKWLYVMPRRTLQVALSDVFFRVVPRSCLSAGNAFINCVRWFHGTAVLSMFPWCSQAATDYRPCRSACLRRQCKRAWLLFSRIPRFSFSRP